MDATRDPPEKIKALSLKLQNLFPPEAERKVSEFKPKDSDIILAGSAKTGTTWLQNIMHGLRSRGDLDFEEMSKEIPLLELMLNNKLADVYAAQKYPPNMYKSHAQYNFVPKADAKRIIVVRNPPDAALSLFYFLQNWFYKKGEVTLSEFIEWFYTKPCPPYVSGFANDPITFIAQAYPHRKEKNVLWLHYDDLKADLKGCIKLVSDFMGIGVGDQELLDLVEHQASFDFMKKNRDKFDSGFTKKMTTSLLGMDSPDGIAYAGSKVRKGVSGEGKSEISPEQMDGFRARWKEVIQPVCGYESYEEMRAGINKELGRSFKES